MAKDFSRMEDSNRSTNPSIHEMSNPTRRLLLRGGLGGVAAGLLGGLGGCASLGQGTASAGRGIGFASVPMRAVDQVVVPAGYTASVLYRWGDPVGATAGQPVFRADAGNTAAEQALQAGMHHDGIHYFPLGSGADGSARGLLAMNHEYVDDGLLHADGMKTWSAEKVAKSIAAHGVSVVEVQRQGAAWSVVSPSRYARRITAATPMALAGPAAGHALMRTAADPAGRTVLGTLNNCGHGATPWGTYLTCEENFVNYFEGPEQPDAHQKRWGMKKGNGQFYRWHEHEERFDASRHPNEFNRFGWVVEIDPADPKATPVKRTALGRAAHEGAALALTADGRGEWLPPVHGQGPLTAARGFADQGEVLIKARQASDLLGATKMDRPEWTAVDPVSKEVYCTLTNNTNRGGNNHPAVDAANPRANNTMGHIIRWKEDGDLDARRFAWTHFVLAGDATLARAEARGNIRGDAFGSPDGLWIDPRGTMWIQTDVSTSALGKGDYAGLPNNQMLACDPTQGEIRRFLLGPAGCEVTGVVMTPDLRTMFVNIQHPGESPSERSDPADPMKLSRWPDGAGRPRSATVVIRKDDGGVIGS
ncbi:PhoX family protein (plasmid) [Sphaerotilus sulfidivorans]|uniref:PhoX family protein n=1 Tax=Sphaerotilus sp. FB-3 TaxID=2913396 RepID=UPI00203E7694